jgi:V/A-type H+-transporting ATPase subunit E
MDNINTQPILELIHADARDAADKLVAGARDRAAAIGEYAGRRIQQLHEETQQSAQSEAILLEDRMRRLALLEVRKDLVAQKRRLIEQAFDEAIKELNMTPSDQVGQIMSDLLVAYAAGDETLTAGSVNDAFFTPDFVNAANERLLAAGKPGKLVMDEKREPGVCGLILKSSHSQTHCTFSALMETRREELEASVATILFPSQEN